MQSSVNKDLPGETRMAGDKARVVLITGAASGIGLASLETMLKAGWRVAAVDRDDQALASPEPEVQHLVNHIYTGEVRAAAAALTGAENLECPRLRRADFAFAVTNLLCNNKQFAVG